MLYNINIDITLFFVIIESLNKVSENIEGSFILLFHQIYNQLLNKLLIYKKVFMNYQIIFSLDK